MISREIENLKKIIKEFRTEMDDLIKDYEQEVGERDSKLAVMQNSGAYTETGLDHFRNTWQFRQDYSTLFKAIRNKYTTLVNGQYTSLDKVLDGYFSFNSSNDYLQRIANIKQLGIELNYDEAMALQNNAKGYLELKAVNSLLDELEQAHGWIFHPRRSMPDYGAILKDIKALKGNINNIIDYYVSECTELSKYIDTPLDTRMTLVSVSNANRHISGEKIFNDVVADCQKMNDSNNSNGIRTLTNEEKYMLDELIDTRYPSLIKERCRTLAKNSRELSDLIRCDERYSKYVADL